MSALIRLEAEIDVIEPARFHKDVTHRWPELLVRKSPHSDHENLAKIKILEVVQQGLRTKRSSSLSAGSMERSSEIPENGQ
uniref:Uncharacterized protein n=1 Tax=Bionectria ochroleuca TaxID=29856 RepID=A0A0B7KI10_BIOOC